LLVLTTGFHRPASPDETESTRAFMEDARQVFAEEGIAFFDCSESLREAVQGDYASIQIVGDGHPNEDGARLISEVNWPAVRAFLEELDRRETVAASNKDALDCR
jgi:hypothetical protein